MTDTTQSAMAVTLRPSSDSTVRSAAVVVDGVRKSYGTTVAVDGISFAVGWGEVFGLLGPNGAGKTTTVEIIAGLRRPDAGRVSVCDLDPTSDAAALRERIGLAVQHSEHFLILLSAAAVRLFRWE